MVRIILKDIIRMLKKNTNINTDIENTKVYIPIPTLPLESSIRKLVKRSLQNLTP